MAIHSDPAILQGNSFDLETQPLFACSPTGQGDPTAGCDLAAATGGTWTGPEFYSCPDGRAGRLQPDLVGPDPYSPNLDNPSLFSAFRDIGFGPVVETGVASGTQHPLIQFVPGGAIRLVPNQPFHAECLLPSGVPFPTCDQTPSISIDLGRETLGWNWSTIPQTNAMNQGDVWTASVLVYVVGPPLATVPVDACTTPSCREAGSAAINGEYTWATYIPPSNNTVVTLSFPLAKVSVEGSPGGPPPPSPQPLRRGFRHRSRSSRLRRFPCCRRWGRRSRPELFRSPFGRLAPASWMRVRSIGEPKQGDRKPDHDLQVGESGVGIR